MLEILAKGIEQTRDLGNYLGAPMVHQRVSKNSFNFMLDKMRKNLSNWTVKSLSFAGKITLTQSCLENIPGYIMRIVSMAISICNATETICRNLFGVVMKANESVALFPGIKSINLRSKVD